MWYRSLKLIILNKCFWRVRKRMRRQRVYLERDSVEATETIRQTKESRKKKWFFSGPATKAFPSPIQAQWPQFFWDFFRASKKFFYLRPLKLTDRKNDKDRDTRKRKLIELFYINVLGKASDIDSEGPGGETG